MLHEKVCTPDAAMLAGMRVDRNFDNRRRQRSQNRFGCPSSGGLSAADRRMEVKETSFLDGREEAWLDSCALLPEDGHNGQASQTGQVHAASNGSGTLPEPNSSSRTTKRFQIEEGEIPESHAFWGSTRCATIVMLWLANIVCYCDRINISVAILHMSEEQNWSLSQQGYVLGAFFYGYVLTQIPGGK
jgi:hypothetical protein